MYVPLRFCRRFEYGKAILCGFNPETRIDIANAPGPGRFAVLPEAVAGRLLDYKLLDSVFNRIVVFADVIIYDKIPCAAVIGKALRNRNCPLCEVVREVLVEIENQALRRTATISQPDFFHNIRLDNFEGVCHIKSGKIRRFQLPVYDRSQQV